MLVLDQTQNNGSADVSVGDSFRVQLSENPTTGYRWYLQSDGAPALRLVQDSFESRGSLPGSGGVRYWIFAAAATGSVALRIELRRSWRPEPISTFGITVSVKAQ
jgi:inhibitor of cysteine peptidase